MCCLLRATACGCDASPCCPGGTPCWPGGIPCWPGGTTCWPGGAPCGLWNAACCAACEAAVVSVGVVQTAVPPTCARLAGTRGIAPSSWRALPAGSDTAPTSGMGAAEVVVVVGWGHPKVSGGEPMGGSATGDVVAGIWGPGVGPSIGGPSPARFACTAARGDPTGTVASACASPHSQPGTGPTTAASVAFCSRPPAATSAAATLGMSWARPVNTTTSAEGSPCEVGTVLQYSNCCTAGTSPLWAPLSATQVAGEARSPALRSALSPGS